MNGECSGENENDSCACSDRRNCLCTKFEDALNHVEDNTVILLNDTLQEFTTNNMLNNITNISIIGFHKFIAINCHARGSIVFKNCKNIVIENITWISCGSNKDNRHHYGLIGSDGLPVLTLIIIFMMIFLDYISMVYTLIVAKCNFEILQF